MEDPANHQNRSQLNDTNPDMKGSCSNKFAWTKYTLVPGLRKVEQSEGFDMIEKGLKVANKLFKSWKQNRSTTSNRKASKNSHKQSSMKTFKGLTDPYSPMQAPYRPPVPLPCRGTRCGGRRQGPLKKLRRGKREEVTKESLKTPGNSRRKSLPNGWINGCHSISDCGLLRYVFSK